MMGLKILYRYSKLFYLYLFAMTAGGAEVKREAKKEAKKEARREARKAAKEAVAQAAARQHHSSQAATYTTKALMKPRQETRVNWYLLCLLNPNDWQEVMNHIHGVPDLFSHLSHVFCTRTFIDIDTSRFDSNGRCSIVVSPQLTNHVAVSTPNADAGSYVLGNYPTGPVSNFLIADSIETGTRRKRAPLPDSSVGSRIYFESFLSAGETTTSSLPQGAVCSNPYESDCTDISLEEDDTGLFQHNNYMIPITAGSNSVRFAITLMSTPAAGAEITVGMLVGNTFRSVVQSVTSSNINIVVPLDPADDRISGYRITNSGTQSLQMTSVRIIGTLTGPNSFRQAETISAENTTRHLSSFSAVRCVAGSAWLKYRGDTTKNGNLAGALVDSLITPDRNRMLGYEQIADYIHSYEGSVQTGMYGIWCPMNYSDLNFNKEGAPGAPYLSYGIDVTDTEAQSFRLECYFIWEGLTQDNVFNPSPGSVDIAMVDHAFHHLAGFNKVMCNSFHLSKITDFLKRGGHNLSKFMSGNTGKALTGALTALSPLVGVPPGVAAGLGIARTALSSM